MSSKDIQSLDFQAHEEEIESGAGNDDSLDEDSTIQFNEATRYLEQYNKVWKKWIRGTQRNRYKL